MDVESTFRSGGVQYFAPIVLMWPCLSTDLTSAPIQSAHFSKQLRLTPRLGGWPAPAAFERQLSPFPIPPVTDGGGGGLPQIGLIYTENKPLGCIFKMCIPFYDELRVIPFANIIKLVYSIIFYYMRGQKGGARGLTPTGALLAGSLQG